jgi:hypothetical protein
MNQENNRYKTMGLEQRSMDLDNSKILDSLKSSNTNVDKANGLEYNVDGCSCMSCGCFKSPWTVVLSPAGVAAGMAAYAAAAVL